MTKLPIARLTFYFGLVYFLQGVCQYTALINQPIKNYLNQTLKYDAQQSATFFFWVGLPWMIKPIYGLISDFFPLLGYRRKSYLLISNLAAAGFFLWMSGVTDVKALMIACIAVGVSVAAADVIVDALMVEFGQKTGLVARFQGVQWACLYSASLLSSVLASVLIAKLSPEGAIKYAAIVCAIMPMIVLTVTWWSVPEVKSKLDAQGFKDTAMGLLAAFRSARLWLVLVLIALLAFNPGMFTPAYYYFTNELKLDPAYVALADTFFSGGAIVAAIAFTLLPTKRLPIRTLQTIGIVVCVVSMIPFCFIVGKTSLAIANTIWGFGYMTGSLATLSLAAAACPKRAEGFVFAALLSASNFSSSWAEVVGGNWYEGFVAHRMWPMVLISMGFTLVALPLVFCLPRELKPADEKDEVRGFAVE